MKFNVKEVAKDLGFGMLCVAGTIAVTFAIVSFMELINMTKDSIRIALAIPLFLYFSYIFGGLTRSVFFKEKGGYFYKD